MSEAIPVFLCGKSPAVATAVKASLIPEYQGKLLHLNIPLPLNITVIQVIMSPEAGALEIPSILQGMTPPASHTQNIGTGNCFESAGAVIMGGLCDENAILEPRNACERDVPWLTKNTCLAFRTRVWEASG